MLYSVISVILFLAAVAMTLYRELGERKKECERLQNSLAVKDEIEMKQAEVIHNLSVGLVELNESVEKGLGMLEKEDEL